MMKDVTWKRLIQRRVKEFLEACAWKMSVALEDVEARIIKMRDDGEGGGASERGGKTCIRCHASILVGDSDASRLYHGLPRLDVAMGELSRKPR